METVSLFNVGRLPRPRASCSVLGLGLATTLNLIQGTLVCEEQERNKALVKKTWESSTATSRRLPHRKHFGESTLTTAHNPLFER